MPDVNVRFQKKGDWNKIGLIMRAVNKKLYRKQCEDFFKKATEEYLKAIRENAYSGSIPMAPLAAYTVRLKEEAGAIMPSAPWIETGYLLDNLKTVKTRTSANRYQWFVGAQAGDVHMPSGLPMATLVRILEYGDAGLNIPARPLFRGTYERVILRWNSELGQLQNKIVRYLQF